MKQVLCYGDSNTWGYDPSTATRYARDVRWTGVLRETLGEGYHIIEEGLNGRTTVWDDPIEGYKNGHTYLVPCLMTHKPLDLVIIMLGTNDLKQRFSVPAFDIANGVGVLVKTTLLSETGREDGAPQVLLVAPPPLARLSDMADMFAGGPAKSQSFGHEFKRVADQYGCRYFNAGVVVTTSDLDGVHFEPEGHRALGTALAGLVRGILA